jgi:hypothetical protein
LNYSPNVKNVQVLEERSFSDIVQKFPEEESNILQDYGASIIMFDIKLNFPMTTIRKYPVVVGCSFERKKGDKLTIIYKPCEHESFHTDSFEWAKKSEIKENDATVQCYFMFDFQSHVFQRLDDNRTQYTQIHIGDLGGWAQNASLMRMVVKKRGNELRKNLMAHLSSKKNSNYREKESFSNDGIGKKVLESLLEYERKLKEIKKKKKNSKNSSTPTL